MAGSWESKAQNQVLCAILHVDNVTTAWAAGLRNLIIPGPPPVFLSGMPYDMARNVAAKHLLDSSLEWLFFLDSDVIPPRDAILRLLAHRKPIISGMYCRRSPPHAVPVAIKNGTWLTQFPANAVIEVDYVGAGCLLIHRDILQRFFEQPQQLGSPVFCWKVNMQGLLPKGECLSEDFTFCLEAKRRYGIPTLLDTSIQCKHVGGAEAGFGTFNPCETRSVT